jgi:tripartite-type tricarboxylate transporter receptor subunit TctC
MTGGSRYARGGRRQKRQRNGIAGREDVMLTRRVILNLVASASVVLTVSEQASAQPYPIRPIKMILPFPPGGPTDSTARLIAEQLSPLLGQPVIVENRPGGAGGTIGAKVVATAEPDGYTLLYTAPGPLITSPAIYRNVGYDPSRFVPVAMVLSSPQMLVVNPAVPARSMRELVVYAKGNPGKLSYVSPGFGTQPHLLGEMLSRSAGINIVHVPYKGAAPAVTDLIAGQVQMYFENIATLLPHVQAGNLRALALADEKRHPQLPDVPTTSESGFPSLQATYWTGVWAPPGTPTALVNRLNTAINQVLKSNETAANFAKLSATPKVGSPDDLAALVAAETKVWTDLINAAGIKGD